MVKLFTFLSGMVITASALAVTPQAGSRVGGYIDGNMRLTTDASQLAKIDPNARRMSTRSGDDIVISERPEGTARLYSRAGWAYMASFEGMLLQSQNGKALEIIEAPDGKTVYFKNILSSNPSDTYVEGTKEGNKISIEAGQPVTWDDEFGYGVVICVGEYYSYEQDGYTYAGYKESETITSIDFTIGDDGVLTLDPRFTVTSDEPNSAPQYVVTGFWSDTDQWVGDSDWDSVYTPFNEEPSLFPDGIELSDYSLRYVNPDPFFNGEVEFLTVKGGIKDGKFYIAGLNSEAPDAVWTGDIAEDGTVTFKANQYMGINGSCLAYTVGATYSYKTEYDPNYGQDMIYLVVNPTGDLKFSYDASAGTLLPIDESILLALNAGCWNMGETLRSSVFMADPEMRLYVEKASVPAMPEIADVGDYYEMGGYIGLNCVISPEDVDGAFLNPELLKYIIYVNDENTPYEFTAEEYPDVSSLDGAGSIIEVPYEFESTDAFGDSGIEAHGVQVYLNIEMPNRLGLRSVYYGGGVRNASEIFWYNTNSSVDGIHSESNVKAEAVYGIDGIRRSTTARGINIQRMSDGSVRKVIIR